MSVINLISHTASHGPLIGDHPSQHPAKDACTIATLDSQAKYAPAFMSPELVWSTGLYQRMLNRLPNVSMGDIIIYSHIKCCQAAKIHEGSFPVEAE